MIAAFLALLASHSFLSVLGHLVIGKDVLARTRRGIALALLSCLFLLAIVHAYQSGQFSRALVSPVWIGLGLLAGHLIFGVSLLVTHRSAEDASSHFFDFASVWRFIVDHPSVLGRFLYVGVSEEIIWRAAAQPLSIQTLSGLLGPGQPAHIVSAAGILLVAAAFSAVHEHFLKNTPLVSLEFLLFALLLGVLFHLTGSLILVIIVHALRDIEIAYLEYVIRVHELGEESLAADEVERIYARPARRRA